MIYEVIATLYFDIEDEANDFYHDCELALPKAIVVHPGQPNQECSRVELIHCLHNESPPEPCTVVNYIDNCPVGP